VKLREWRSGNGRVKSREWRSGNGRVKSREWRSGNVRVKSREGRSGEVPGTGYCLPVRRTDLSLVRLFINRSRRREIRIENRNYCANTRNQGWSFGILNLKTSWRVRRTTITEDGGKTDYGCSQPVVSCLVSPEIVYVYSLLFQPSDQQLNQ